MADNSIKISLSTIRNTKKVFIDGIGGFTVRKMGAGESLDLSSSTRRLGKILEELHSIDFTKYDLDKKEDRVEIDKLQEHVDELSNEITEIKRAELDAFKRCFEDDNGGKNVDLLIDTLTETERSILFAQIFEEKEAIDKPLLPEEENS